jgi:hypothetical protein
MLLKMSSLPVILIITSEGCGACSHLRGPTGVPIEPKNIPSQNHFFGESWSPTFFKKLITGNINGTGPTKFRVSELHLNSLDGRSILNCKEFIEFSMENNKFIRIVYVSKDNKTSIKVYKDSVEDKSKSKILDIPFGMLLINKVPQNLNAFLGTFPSFIFIDGNIYDNALQNNGNLYGKVTSRTLKKTVKNGEVIYNSEHNGLQENPIDIMTKIVNGNLSLLFPVEISEDKIITEVVEKKIVVESSIPLCKKSYRITSL